MPGRAELAVDAGRGELAEQVLVQVALGVALGSGRASIMLTAETSRLGFWMRSWASVMYSAKVDSLSPSVRKCGKTLRPGPLRAFRHRASCLKFDQRSFCCFELNWPLNGLPSRVARFSALVSAMSSSRENMRNEICSMTVSGLVMPPVQNSVQSLSIWLRSAGNHATEVPSLGGWNDSMMSDDGIGLVVCRETGRRCCRCGGW